MGQQALPCRSEWNSTHDACPYQDRVHLLHKARLSLRFWRGAQNPFSHRDRPPICHDRENAGVRGESFGAWAGRNSHRRSSHRLDRPGHACSSLYWVAALHAP